MNDENVDRELAHLLKRHIEKPCVDLNTGLNIREFYIREAKRIIETSTDPTAIKILEECTQPYKIN